MNIGFYSYLGAACAYTFFAFLLLFSWRGSLQGKLLFVTMSVSAIWAFVAAKIAMKDESFLLAYQSLDILRYIVWYIFLFKLFSVALASGGSSSQSYRRFLHWAMPLAIGLASLLLLNELFAALVPVAGQFVFGITGNVLLALIGLALIEQLFRNISPQHRWATKYLFLGAGGIFVYDFYFYADALLFRAIDQDLWASRGVIHIVAVPLLAIASARNKNWSLNIFVSRDIVLNTTAVLGGGFYLLAMAAAGYYLREFGGSWGKVGQITFIALAVVLLFVILSSAHLRAQIKVFLGKHFYKNKYDYRIEWLRLTDDLNADRQMKNRYQVAIQAMAHIVEARAGSLWLRDDTGNYINAGVWQSKRLSDVVARDDVLIRFMSSTGYIINLHEVESRADEYDDLVLPALIAQMEQPWLIIPLPDAESLLGFVVLSNPLLLRSINWEDRDLLKTAAKQVSSYLLVLTTSAQLAEAKQFEVFSRLSAFMVHDLKNIAAELELVAINAKKFADNPEFVSDAFETVENASSDIRRLLEQLRNKKADSEKVVEVNVVDVVSSVVAAKQFQKPVPSLKLRDADCFAMLERGRFSNVVAHLIDNAQQATPDTGEVLVEISHRGEEVVIDIKDSGHGMDEDFIQRRLFKPFDTTKGNAGMGIGMFESREFIRQSGGDIMVQSKPGKGSIISLHIPASSSAMQGELLTVNEGR